MESYGHNIQRIKSGIQKKNVRIYLTNLDGKGGSFWYNGCLMGLPCSTERGTEAISNKLRNL
jgi:hypothetical protein